MHVKSLRVRSHKSFKVDETVHPKAAERLGKIKTYDRLRGANCRADAALEQIGVSRGGFPTEPKA